MRRLLCLGLLAIAGTASAGTSYVIFASANRISVGGYLIWDRGSRRIGPTYAQAIAAYGTDRTCRFLHGTYDALVRWRALGVSGDFTTLGGFSRGGNACTRPREVFLDHLTVTDLRWTTARGLRVGDSVARLRRLYPRAARHGSSYWMITDSNPAVGSRPLFAANTRNGLVISFLFVIQAEGE